MMINVLAAIGFAFVFSFCVLVLEWHHLEARRKRMNREILRHIRKTLEEPEQ